MAERETKPDSSQVSGKGQDGHLGLSGRPRATCEGLEYLEGV